MTPDELIAKAIENTQMQSSRSSVLRELGKQCFAEAARMCEDQSLKWHLCSTPNTALMDLGAALRAKAKEFSDGP